MWGASEFERAEYSLVQDYAGGRNFADRDGRCEIPPDQDADRGHENVGELLEDPPGPARNCRILEDVP